MENQYQFRGVPTFFRYGCLEAQRGGSMSYSNPAWNLAIHTEENMPYDCDDEEQWEKMLDDLREAAGKQDSDAIWQWYSRVFPRCMELVPPRRKDQFAEGIILAWNDGKL